MSEPARSDIPDPVSAALQGPASEYLAGILALSRLSRVTVACRSGAYPAANLLAVAKLTGIPGETALLFDRWQGGAGPDLAQALRAAVGAGGNAAALPGSDGPVLAILDRFEIHLGLPPDDARARDDGETLCALADDARADIHFLLLVEESAAPLLQRYAARIPGITEASLRLPPHADGFDAEQPAPASATGAAARKRSFGALLERLTERSGAAPLAAAGVVEERAAPLAQQAAAFEPDAQAALADAGAAPPLPQPEAEPSLDAIVAQAPIQAAAPEHSAAPAVSFEPMPQAAVAQHAAIDRAPDVAPPELEAAAESAELGAAPAPAPAAEPVAAPAPARRRGGRLALAGIALAALALILVSRFPAKPDRPDTRAAQAAPAPAEPSGAAAPAAAQAKVAAAADAPAPAAAAAATTATTAAPASPAAASAPSAQRGAATAASRRTPALYILVNSSRERERLRPIARSLARQGIEVMNIQPIGRGPKVSDLRYFYREEREDALKIQQALQDAGITVRNVNLVQGYESRAPRRQLELWLASDSPAAPAAATRRKQAAGH
jgi:hypothetical protein